jgi:hypothetical protein
MLQILFPPAVTAQGDERGKGARFSNAGHLFDLP